MRLLATAGEFVFSDASGKAIGFVLYMSSKGDFCKASCVLELCANCAKDSLLLHSSGL